MPNNLPANEKFDSTGLIGRTKEVESLLSDLTLGRINTFALVGPGGVGKTSIAIEVTRKIADSAGSARRFDGVVYLSFKAKDLTARGLVTVSGAAIQRDLDKQFYASLERVYALSGLSPAELLELAAKDDLVIVLDNFEDLLLECSADCEAFLNKLPGNWKVVITSRVSVDAAKNIAVKGLSQGAIEGLARKYYEAVTGRFIDAETLEKAKTACNGNPLALKLMIDRVGLGASISEAKALTHNEILEYSFTSLIQSLSESQKSVLEAIFVLGAATRVTLLELTDLQSEDLIECLNSLSRTSLIERSTSEFDEQILIASAVRELLARSPLNLEIRAYYSKRLATIRNKSATAPVNVVIDTFSFDPKTPAALKTLGAKLPRLWAHQNVALSARDEQYVKNFEEKIVAYESSCRGMEDYYRLRAYSRALLRDTEMALTFARTAFEIAPNSIVAGQLYANLLITLQKNAEAREVLSRFIEDLMTRIGKGEDLLQVYGATIVRETFSSFFKTFIWFKEFDEVIKLTELWGRVPEFLRIIFAVSRSSALRQKHEREPRTEPLKCKILLECAKMLTYCYQDLEVPVLALNREAVKVRKDLSYRISTVPPEFRDEFVKASNALTADIGDAFPVLNVLVENEDGPLSGAFGGRPVPEGVTQVEIYSIKHTYCFGKSDAGEQFFVPFAIFENGRTPHRIGDKACVWDLAPTAANNGAKRAGAARLL